MNKVSSFNSGAQAADWTARNCELCKKQYRPGKYFCLWQLEIVTAFRTDGRISEQCARAIGFTKLTMENYTWECPSLVPIEDSLGPEGGQAVPDQFNLFQGGQMENNETTLAKNAVDAFHYVKALEIKDEISLSIGNKFLVRIGIKRKEIGEYFNKPIKKAHEAHKAILSTKKLIEQPLIAAEEDLRHKIKKYVVEQQRIRDEAERIAKEEEDRKKREAEKAMEEAAKLENEGKIKEALDKLNEAEKIETEKPAVEIPKRPTMTGVHTRKYWRWKVIDMFKIPWEYLMVNQRAVDAEVQRSKGDTNIPGIAVYEETEIARSGGRS